MLKAYLCRQIDNVLDIEFSPQMHAPETNYVQLCRKYVQLQKENQRLEKENIVLNTQSETFK
jgi:hypothetical protein